MIVSRTSRSSRPLMRGAGQRLPTRDVYRGEGTTDEKCLGNVLAAESL